MGQEYSIKSSTLDGSAVVAHFGAEKLLGKEAVRTSEVDVAAANRDWLGRYHGMSRVVLTPSSTEQVAAALRYSNERRLGIVPQGGNTGLVGGSVPVQSGTPRSTRRCVGLTPALPGRRCAR